MNTLLLRKKESQIPQIKNLQDMYGSILIGQPIIKKKKIYFCISEF